MSDTTTSTKSERLRKEMTMVNMDDYNEDTRRSMDALKIARRSFTGGAASPDATLSIDESLVPDWLRDDNLTCNQKILRLLESRQVVFFIVWFAWLITGSIYYAIELNLGAFKGFYMAVNVGYSIGWGDIATPELSFQWFSCFYVMIGASFVGAALGFFAEGVVADSDNWYTNCKIATQYEDELKATHNPFKKAWKWCGFHWIELRAIILWLVFVLSATIGACITQDWHFITGLYFAVSSISTGGLQALEPTKTTDFMYGMTGLYSCLGVPLMAVAMGTLAAFLMPKVTIEDTMGKIRSNITEEEVSMLVGMGMADGDGIIDRTEFIVLGMIRIGAADPMLIHLVMEYFDLLDDDASGGLSLEEITTSSKQLKAKVGLKAAAHSVKNMVSAKRQSLKNAEGTAADGHTDAIASVAQSQTVAATAKHLKRKSLHDIYAEGGTLNELSDADRLNRANEEKKDKINELFRKQIAAVTAQEMAGLVATRLERPIGGASGSDGEDESVQLGTADVLISTASETDERRSDNKV